MHLQIQLTDILLVTEICECFHLLGNNAKEVTLANIKGCDLNNLQVVTHGNLNKNLWNLAKLDSLGNVEIMLDVLVTHTHTFRVFSANNLLKEMLNLMLKPISVGD